MSAKNTDVSHPVTELCSTIMRKETAGIAAAITKKLSKYLEVKQKSRN